MNAIDRPWTPITDGVWIDTAPVNILGMPLTATMTVLRLGDGSLLVHSPLECTQERRARVEALGRVAHLYAPNVYHHLWIGGWADAFPSARVHAPAALAKKRPDLRIDRTHDASGEERAFEGVIDERHVEGFRLEETALVHRPSRTLIVADVVQHVGRPDHAWAKAYTRAMGFYDKVALSRAIRWAGFSDRTGARRSIDAILALPFDRIVVGHGAPIVEGAHESLEAAYMWLPRSQK